MIDIPVRVQRDGRWQAIDLDELTDAELSQAIDERRSRGDDGWTWVAAILVAMRPHLDDLRAGAGGEPLRIAVRGYLTALDRGDTEGVALWTESLRVVLERTP
jgi:hypothetical protein